MRTGVLVMAVLLAAHGSAAADPKTYRLTVGGTEAKPAPTRGDGLADKMTDAEGFVLQVDCTAPIDCKKVEVSLFDPAGTPLPTTDARPQKTDRKATFQFTKAATITISYQAVDTPLYKGALEIAARVEPPVQTTTEVHPEPPPPPPPHTTMASTLTTQCQAMELDAKENEVYVTPLGSMLTVPPALFSEAETLTVTVVADDRLLDLLQVRRKSPRREVIGRILGEEEKVQIFREAAAHDVKAPCAMKSFTVSNFAPGAGEVEILARVGDAPVSLGTFEIQVDPVYKGMFSIGAVWTPMISPSFSVVQRNGVDVIGASESGDRRMLYALMYTPFLWEGLERDVREPLAWDTFYHHINPTVGFALNDPLNNAFLGVSFDLQTAIVFTTGAMFSHVEKLDGVTLGDAVADADATIPTTKTWKHDWFVGVTVDVRVGVKLLRTVLGTAGD